jgi:rubredoxin-NAD+ reductase
MSGLVIVGSGLGAYMTAKAWRKLDNKTPLTIVTREAGGFYSKPQLSTGFAHKKAPADLMVNSTAEMAEQLQAKILTHTTVQSLSPEQKQLTLSQGETLAYDQLVLATGAEVLHPPLAGDAVSEVLSVNVWADYDVLRQRLQGAKTVAILGAGLVGCELANDFVKAGFAVRVIAPDDTPLQRYIPAPLGLCLRQALTQAGVDWYLGQFATDINRCDSGYELTLCHQQGSVQADVVVSAIGFRPNTHLARAAGLVCEQAIQVDRHFRTSDAAIYALGDCAAVDGVWRPYVAPILQGSQVLAKNLVGEAASIDYAAMPVVAKTSLCPVTACLPGEEQGQWHIEGDAPDLLARYQREDGALLGFALCGQAIRQRQALLAELSSV